MLKKETATESKVKKWTIKKYIVLKITQITQICQKSEEKDNNKKK